MSKITIERDVLNLLRNCAMVASAAFKKPNPSAGPFDAAIAAAEAALKQAQEPLPPLLKVRRVDGCPCSEGLEYGPHSEPSDKVFDFTKPTGRNRPFRPCKAHLRHYEDDSVFKEVPDPTGKDSLQVQHDLAVRLAEAVLLPTSDPATPTGLEIRALAAEFLREVGR